MAVQVLSNLEDIILSVAIDAESSRNCHVEVAFNVGLRVCEDKVELTGVPTIDEGDNQKDSNRDPLDDRGIRLPEVDALLLLPTVDVEASLPLVDFLSSDSAFASERPHGIEDFDAFWDRTARQELPMAILRVRVDLLLHSFDEFGSIWLFHRDSIMERIRIGALCRKSDRVLHLPLKVLLPVILIIQGLPVDLG